MSHVYFSAPGNATWDSVTTNVDYSAPVPTNLGLSIAVDANGFAITIELPADTTGKVYCIKKTDASINSVFITVVDGGTIDGGAAYRLNTENESVFIQCYESGVYYVNSDYDPAGSGVTPTLQQVCVAGNQTGTNIIATTYNATGTVLYTSNSSFAVDATKFDYRFDLNAMATTVAATLPTGAAVNGQIFVFHVLNNYPVSITAVNITAPVGGTINGQPPANVFPVSVLYETLILKCVSNTGDYIRLSPSIRQFADIFAVTSGATATIPLTHRLTTVPTSANVSAANAAAAALLAGGNWWLTFTTVAVIINFPAPVGPIVAAQFWLQAWANR